MADNKDTVMVPKDPSEHGETKYLVEVFVAKRFVITVYADDKEQAVQRAKAAPYRSELGLLGIRCVNGVSHSQFDEDFGFQITSGEGNIDDDPEHVG